MRQDFEVSKYGAGEGLLLASGSNAVLDVLNDADLLGLLSRAGYLIFRGFDTSIEQFSALVRSVCTRTMLDPAREFIQGKTVQKVDIGTGPIGPHVEHGTNPLTPHLTWFFCRQAARQGSQTTVCDGYRVWEALSEQVREVFLSKDIAYSRNIGEQTWRSLVAYVLGDSKPEDEITIDDVVELAKMFGDGFRVQPNDDASIYYTYRVPAAHPTLFAERLAFANSILGPSYHYEKPRIAFADGSDIPHPVIAEVKSVIGKLTEDIDWQDGDVAVIDNTRVMHGRRAILDPERREIYVALGYVDNATSVA